MDNLDNDEWKYVLIFCTVGVRNGKFSKRACHMF